ncbi:alpha/beta hydrolase [Lentilactobacillus buchneri]|uniref:AB hydrolase-1 domain-containing protein n=1 Tax=Lentilactobacillus buchneri DSM 20057 TaxID=1423728 RepID=A0A4R5NR17_LENBU|nr:alpha/beta fold hydrolase [Lentilactobacillus buchneri]KRK69570.1 cell surface hydrolase [Lentilactobacillus buchneri DSM 20057]MCT3253102.1 alpha/beta fold hydrolase [Lentilactobacillus buchneri]MCT3547696.1 alpha/beta fold hydrolase [Lentilactobacillus buchneri]MCT4438098.1 alpha/beta fold hydrolase [Lentilactobacillus buchneri]QUX06395.1 alpha/beta fold hydrolase [Lentilactobacillus buchneri]
MNISKHFNHSMKLTACLGVCFGFLLLADPTYADTSQAQTSSEPTATATASSSTIDSPVPSSDSDSQTTTVDQPNENAKSQAVESSNEQPTVPETDDSSSEQPVPANHSTAETTTTSSSTDNQSDADTATSTTDSPDDSSDDTPDVQPNDSQATPAEGAQTTTNNPTDQSSTTGPSDKDQITIDGINQSTDPAIKQSSNNPLINFLTSITSGIAASVIYPLVASRQGAQFISHFRTLLSPNRWDVSQNWADLDQKYNPDYVKTYYTDAQDWYDNRVQKQTWEVPFADGAGTARATYLKNGDSKKTIIYGQGWTTEPEGMGRISKMFYDMGYNVLMPYTRGQNSSDGEWLTFGDKDKQDWVNWINKIDQTNGQDSQIVLYGQSLGADTALQYAGQGNLPSSVKATIADCGFSTIPSLIYHLYTGAANSLNSITSKIGWNLNGSIPLVPFDQLLTAMNGINKLVQGFSLDDVSGITAVKNSKLPTLFISTEDDTFIPDTETETMYNLSASTDKKLWVLDGHVGGHASASNAVQDYMKNIEDFLASAMNQSSSSSDDQLNVPATNKVAA